MVLKSGDKVQVIRNTKDDNGKAYAKKGQHGTVKGIAKVAKVAGIIITRSKRLVLLNLEDIKKI